MSRRIAPLLTSQVVLKKEPGLNIASLTFSAIGCQCAIRVKLHKTHQAVTLFQDGKNCAEHNYHDGNFDTMYFKKAISVKEL